MAEKIIYPRVVRPVPDPLGLYFRVGRASQKDLSNLIAVGDAACFGVVFDPTLLKPHQELRDQVLNQRLDAILDPRTQPSATPGGYNATLGVLPWGVGRPHIPSDFTNTAGRRLIAALGDFILEKGFTQVLAPTHILRSAHDPWLAIDIEATGWLRNHLDRNGGSHIPIIYSLALPYAVLRDSDQRLEVIEAVRGVPAIAVWLKVDGFGSDSTATGVRNYIEAAKDFNDLGIPVVADHVGGMVGLSLLAFGAAGGLVHGVAQNERFHAGHWRKPRSSDGFGVHLRVYIPQLDLLLKPSEAHMLFSAPARTRIQFICRDTDCCPRGVIDTLDNPARHFLYQRIKQVSGLAQIPEQLRTGRFLEQHLRPATDAVLAAANFQWEDETFMRKMRDQRKRLDMLRVALGNLEQKMPVRPVAVLPQTRAARDARPYGNGRAP